MHFAVILDIMMKLLGVLSILQLLYEKKKKQLLYDSIDTEYIAGNATKVRQKIFHDFGMPISLLIKRSKNKNTGVGE